MASHYNAFISYRHAPLDSKVAGTIQRELERYRIPKAIRQQTGFKRIDRIFRDKEELPITSDLNDDISTALANSDHLIVICSTVTKESVWVEKEIENFLKTHSKKQVLTVLVSGEPYDVIPEILLYDDVETLLPDGSRELKRIPIEPLSCDVRGDLKKALKTELHRLAAPLLGCSFDALYQRQKQYQRKKLTVILSTVITGLTLLSSYFLWSTVQIQKSYRQAEENYQQSLANQSRFLSSEALSLLQNGNRIGAIRLALHALPEETDSRPLVPEAEYAMVKALNAYDTSGSRSGSVFNFTHQSDVTQFCAAAKDTRLWVMDDQRTVYLWDTENFTQLRRWTSRQLDPDGKYYFHLYRLSDDLILLTSSYLIRCLDARTGDTLWEQPFPISNGLQCTMNVDGTLLGCLSAAQEVIYLLEPRTGKLLNTLPIPMEDDPGDRTTVAYCAFSPDGSQIAFSVRHAASAMDPDAHGCVHTVSLDGSDPRFCPVQGRTVGCLRYSPSGDIFSFCKSTLDPEGLYESTLVYDSYGFDTAILYPQQSYVNCIDSKTTTLRWSDRQLFTQLEWEPEPLFTSVTDADGNRTEILCHAMGSSCFAYNCANGNLINSGVFPASVAEFHFSGDQTVAAILENGKLANYRIDTGSIAAMQMYLPSISGLERAGTETPSVYLVSKEYGGSQSVLMYRKLQADPDWQPMADDLDIKRHAQTLSYGDWFFCTTQSDYSSPTVLRAYDVRSRKLLFRDELLADSFSGTQKILGYLPEQDVLVLWHQLGASHADNRTSLRLYHLPEGSVQVIDLPQITRRSEDLIFRPDSGSLFCLTQKGIYTLNVPDSGAEVGFIPYLTEDDQMLFGSAPESFGSTAVALFHTFNKETATDDYLPHLLDLNTGALTPLPGRLGIGDYLYPAVSPDEARFAIHGGGTIHMLDQQGRRLFEIPLEGLQLAGMTISPDGTELWTMCTDQVLRAYDAETGDLLRSVELPDIAPYKSGDNIRWQFLRDGSLLLIDEQSAGSGGAIIDPAQWLCRGFVNGCWGFNLENDVFLIPKTTEKHTDLGIIPRYSTEALIARAREELHGMELTPEQKAAYGLS